MKNIKMLGFLLLGFFVLFSCKREFEYDENASIEGVWQPMKVRASGTYLGFPFVKYEDANDCQKQSRVTYKADFTGAELAYDNEPVLAKMLSTELSLINLMQNQNL